MDADKAVVEYEGLRVPRTPATRTQDCQQQVGAQGEGNRGGPHRAIQGAPRGEGFLQQYGVDFEKIFAQVVKLASIRITLSIVAQYKLVLRQMDIKIAFLNSLPRKRFT